MLHRNKTVKQQLREFDFAGLVLFSTGMVLFLMGLNWGGVSAQLCYQAYCDC